MCGLADAAPTFNPAGDLTDERARRLIGELMVNLGELARRSAHLRRRGPRGQRQALQGQRSPSSRRGEPPPSLATHAASSIEPPDRKVGERGAH